MGKVLTDVQKSLIAAIDHDASLNIQQRTEKLTTLYRSFGAPYDRVVFRVAGSRIRAVLAKRTPEQRLIAAALASLDDEVPI